MLDKKGGESINIVLLGLPGSGKGTQAELLSEKKGFFHLSTGDLFRKEIAQKTALGKIVEKTIKAGKLVSDILVLEITKKAAGRKRKLIFDGIPRTLNQAKLLDQSFKIDLVFFFKVPERILIRRLANRMICKCGASYNSYNKKPKKDRICDKCGAKLFVRDDDKPEIVKKRLEINKKSLNPILAYYEKKGILVVINGNDTITNVYKNIIKCLK